MIEKPQWIKGDPEFIYQKGSTRVLILEKLCPDCERWLHPRNFHKNATRPQGLCHICKKCSKDRRTLRERRAACRGGRLLPVDSQ